MATSLRHEYSREFIVGLPVVWAVNLDDDIRVHFDGDGDDVVHANKVQSDYLLVPPQLTVRRAGQGYDSGFKYVPV